MGEGYDIAVVGGGLAGLTAGLTGARLGRSTIVLTGGVPGGLLLAIERIDGMPGFPAGVAGYELCPTVQQQAEEAGAEIASGELTRLQPAGEGWTIATDDGEMRASAVIVATGARFRRLGVPGEERLIGRGVSTCASCDGPLFGGRAVAVVGGGDSALQEALALVDLVERVVILHRGQELRGQEGYRRRVVGHPKIDVRLGTAVEEIVGDDRVGGVRVRDRVTGAVEEIEVAAVFPYVGLQPNSEPVGEWVALAADGGIRTDAALRTSAPGVFAAGIVRSGAAGRAAAAAGDGATAAVAADSYLRHGGWPTELVGAPALEGAG